MSLLSVPAIAFYIGSFPVHWYGVIISFSMLIAILIAYHEVKRQHLDPDNLMDIVLLAIPAAVVGARLYYVFVNWDYYGQNPDQIIAIWNGGSAIHGGVFLAVVVSIIYCHKKKLNFLQWADLAFMVVILAQGIGRWGNYINHEAYGPVIAEGSFWSWMPFQVFAEGAYHHPLFLYESVMNFVIFAVLFYMMRRPHRYGYIFASYLIFYDLGRFFLEYLRNEPLMIGPYRGAQLWCAAAVLAGALILWFIRKNPVVDVSAVPKSPKKSKASGRKK